MTSSNTDEEAPVQSGGDKVDVSSPTPCPIVSETVADTTADTPIVEDKTESDDVVMLSDDESGENGKLEILKKF